MESFRDISEDGNFSRIAPDIVESFTQEGGQQGLVYADASEDLEGLRQFHHNLVCELFLV